MADDAKAGGQLTCEQGAFEHHRRMTHKYASVQKHAENRE